MSLAAGSQVLNTKNLTNNTNRDVSVTNDCNTNLLTTYLAYAGVVVIFSIGGQWTEL